MPLAPVLVVRLDEHQPGDLAVRAGSGLQRDPRHARDLGEVAL